MKTKHILLAAALAALFGPAAASDQPQPVIKRDVRVHMAGDMAGLHGMRHKVVKHAPYSATVVGEHTQVLADGNRITNRRAMKHYRDSEGRTRQEVVGDDGTVRSVIIRDGADMLVLRPSSKTGTRITRDLPEVARLARERAHEKVEQLRREGKLPADATDKHGEAIVVRRVERMRHPDHPGAAVAEDVRVRVMRDHDGPAHELHQLGPMIVHAFGDRKYARDARVTSLGTREIAGVKAEGKLRSYEIPAGAIGNDKPITVSDESWFSPELQMTVYHKHSDPRTGERVYRLDDLRRAEPAADLFAAPAGYEIKSPAERMRKRMEKRMEKEKEKEKAKDKQ